MKYFTFSILLNTCLCLTSHSSDLALRSIETDWDKDGHVDIAQLIRESPESDYLSLDLIISGQLNNIDDSVRLSNFVWEGEIPGTMSWLGLNRSGSLVVHSGNASIGRERWSQKIVIAYRKNKIIVAGFYFESTDTLNGRNSTCDVNLLTGQGYKNSTPFSVGVKILPATQWDEEMISELCTL